MRSVLKQLRRGEREAASRLPQVIDGDALTGKALKLKERPNGKWAIHRGAHFLKSTGTRDLAEAQTYLKIFELQLEAKEDGIVEPRYVQASVA
jgi:hypothetical protein